MLCPHCGATASTEARFCANCGRAMHGDDVTAVTRPSSSSDKRPSSASDGWLTSSDSISHGRFAPGTILDGRYRIIGLLGKGGMGEVYRADNLRLGQPVALKFLPDAVAADAVRLAQFHNEVRTARQISHPNICRVYDIGEVDGQLFLSMELVDGEDLASSLRRIGRFPEDKATDIARQLCAGLAAAHERGVLHRDLKPANVMLDGSGKVRLMDFGLAAVGVVEDIRAGTPAYMAPEQLLGREVTARSDIYALGLVLYELFTGRRAFTASTLNELIEQHQSGQVTPPRTIVGALDPSIEDAILRCLDADPMKRPSSALGVSAALPGGDPLAAALAAGETPSPEMVAAAGEGAGLHRRFAIAVYVAVLAGIAGVYAMSLRSSALDRLRPEYTSDVLAQKARDTLRQLGYTERPADEAYGFEWDAALLDTLNDADHPAGRWTDALSQRPSPLLFWYRRSPSAMTGVEFHHDLLTPGIVTMSDPAPIEPGMIQLKLDHQGLLTWLEAIPPQIEEPQAGAPALDWSPLLTLAGLDPATLQATAPTWNWLSAPDTRMAWTVAAAGRREPLRAEAAARRGRPVAFMAIAPWTKPWRASSPVTGQETAFVIAIFALALAIIGAGSMLARKHLREGRGDRAGAQNLGSTVAVALWALWVCQVHGAVSVGLLGNFLVTVCTTVFYAAMFWAIYLALEPFVRRYWPQTLVSWTTLLSGRVRHPIVGRDVLLGAALGVTIALLLSGTSLLTDRASWAPTELLNGMRGTASEILMQSLYATRTALFIFFLLFLMRALLRSQWLAALAIVLIFTALNMLTSDHPLADGATTFLFFSLSAAAVLRWGLTTLAVSVLVANLLVLAPATTDPSAWYLGEMILVLAIPLTLATWGFWVATEQARLRGRGRFGEVSP